MQARSRRRDAVVWALAALAFMPVLWAGEMSYSAAAIVNAASNVPGALAPNTLATIYGTELAYSTRAIAPEDIRGGRLPVELAGVTVVIDGIAAVLYYVSPGQINFLIPGLLRKTEMELTVLRNGYAGPSVRLPLRPAAPALFLRDERTVIALRSDWTEIRTENPARPGDYVVLYATGLGSTVPEPLYPEPPRTAAPLERIGDFEVLLGGVPVARERITYAGAAPGFAGLYQINVKLPETVDDDAEVRISLAGETSPPGLRLPVRNTDRQPTLPQQFPLPPR